MSEAVSQVEEDEEWEGSVNKCKQILVQIAEERENEARAHKNEILQVNPTTQHNTAQHNTTQQNTQHNPTQHKTQPKPPQHTQPNSKTNTQHNTTHSYAPRTSEA